MHTILIQGAMKTEINDLICKMPGGLHRTVNGYEFYETKEPETCTRIIISLTHMGIMNACIATQLGIHKYSPDCVINQGTAGGHTPDMHVGDIVIGETAVYINNTRSPAKKSGEGSNALLWLPDDDSLKPYRASEKLADIAREISFDAKILCGRLGSGDIYSREADRIELLHSQLGELCEDMESAAVYKTCEAFNVPVIGIRIISNNELTCEAEDFARVEKMLQKYIYKYIQVLCKI